MEFKHKNVFAYRHKNRRVTQENIAKILKEIELGSPRKHAAEAHGITETTFHNLVKQGLVDLEDGEDSIESKLVVSLRQIENKEIQECRKLIRKYKYSHKGCEWTLEKVYWRYFGNNSQLKELQQEIDDFRKSMKEGTLNHGKTNNDATQENPHQ
jgi:hypothetical protein